MNIRVYADSDGVSLHKPLLILLALGKLIKHNQRLIPFSEIDSELGKLFLDFFPSAFTKKNTHYPFGKLENDGIWEVENSDSLKRTSVGHLLKSELIEKNIHGGFKCDIFNYLSTDKMISVSIAEKIAENYFKENTRKKLLDAVFITDFLKTSVISSVREKPFDIYKPTSIKSQFKKMNNSYISYLNSLHNISAGGSNALAESQAMNPFFGELYTPFSVVKGLIDLLEEGSPKVVILTGHAGDGKSTVALDIFKTLNKSTPSEPLAQPMKDRENVPTSTGTVSIIKDMSELSARCREDRLKSAFDDKEGSWLIISNTGPLLSSLTDYAENAGLNKDIESEILKHLDKPIENASFDNHSVPGFPKKLYIFNLTRWNNLELVNAILSKLVNHSGWDSCTPCALKTACPLLANRTAVREHSDVVGERIRWIYQRSTAYEHRLTLRQILAHLAFGLTGGLSCTEAWQRLMPTAYQTPESIAAAPQRTLEFEKIVFSESFFGYRAGLPWAAAENLQAVALVRRDAFGAPASVHHERQLATDVGMGWACLPPTLENLSQQWQGRASEPSGVPVRSALRRMAYLFGKTKPDAQKEASLFLDLFIQSPSLRRFDEWQKDVLKHKKDIRGFRHSCLQVLLEFFSGYNPRQFDDKNEKLYLTLRRPDKAVVQPTQLVIRTINFDEFDLRFEKNRAVWVLSFKKAKAELELNLPLLDYIDRRNAGELGNTLSPIHQAKLECFRSALLQATAETDDNEDEIMLLRASIDGGVHIHRFLLDNKKMTLEKLN